MSLGTPKIYCRKGSTGSWWECSSSDYVTIKDEDVTGKKEIYIRVELNLPKIETDIENYNVSGTVEAKYHVGSSVVTYSIDVMDGNNKKIPVSRNPKIIDYNGQSYSSSPRIIKSGTKVLKNITNAGNKDNVSGNDSSLHYGVGYQPFSTKNYFSIYQHGNESDIKSVKYKYASMSDLNNVTTSENIANKTSESLSLDASTDTRYIVEYEIQDSKYSSKAQSLTNNADRGKVTGHRVIWASDKVTVQDGFEIYADKLSVTMSKEDFKNFDSIDNKAGFYQKIAEEAGIKVFQTSLHDFTDLTKGNQTGISGNGDHTGVQNALSHLGKAYDVPIQFASGNTKVVKYIKLTIQDDIPTVVAEDGSIKDMTSEKIIFNGENFTVSGTFKLQKSNGTFMDYDDLQDKSKVKVALYKKNATGKTNADKFYRWVGGNTADLHGLDMVGGIQVSKVELPAKITDNQDGTFTVSFTRYNHQDGQSTGSQNWVSQDWDHLSEYRIYCWTESNGQDIKYDNNNDTATDEVEINHTGSTAKAPSSTTKMVMITRDNGNLPSAMFEISNVKLNDDGTQLSDKRKTTTISLKKLNDITNFDKAEHDYYYEVSVNETNSDSSQRPYTTLTQSDTGKNFNATYLKYQNNTYSDVKNDDLVLGSIAYPSNKNSPPQSIRFGMRADKQTGMTSNTKFTGTAHFKFKRVSLSGGANP